MLSASPLKVIAAMTLAGVRAYELWELTLDAGLGCEVLAAGGLGTTDWFGGFGLRR